MSTKKEHKEAHKGNEVKRSLRIIVMVIDKEYGEEVTEFLENEGVGFSLVCMGEGTATSEILDLLNLGETEKEVIISLTTKERAKQIVEKARGGAFESAGILFTLKPSCIGGTNSLKLIEALANKN